MYFYIWSSKIGSDLSSSGIVCVVLTSMWMSYDLCESQMRPNRQQL